MSQSIAKILEDIETSYEGSQEKTASQDEGAQNSQEPANIDQARQKAANSLSEILGSQSQEKQASASQGGDANDAIAHLEKMASDMVEAEQQATIKEAHLFGASVFDGFMARAQQYAGGSQKTASQNQQADQQMLKQASAAGYQETAQLLQGFQGAQAQRNKTAQEEEMRGIVDGMEKLAELSEDCFVRGHNHMQKIAEQMQGQ